MNTSSRPPSWAALWACGALLLWLLYTLIFLVTTRIGLSRASTDALANVVPLAILAASIHALLKQYVVNRPIHVQAAAHVALSLGFALTWYSLTIVLLAFFAGLRGKGWNVELFWGPALTWQTFQGLILYGLVAAVCYAVRGGQEATSVTTLSDDVLDRYLIRDDEGMRPIDVGEIVTITGAQDYSEVATLSGRHLVRMGLADFERRLDRRRFLRVHRSSIINFHRLSRTEPAGGGRMLAHMTTGEVVAVSRSGARLLRSLAV